VKLLRSILVALVVVLATTGVALLWLYHPGTPWAWVRTVHSAASWAALLVGIAYLVAVVADRRQMWRWPHVVGLLALLIALRYTGFLLPWEQLALAAVTVGTNIKGALAVLTEDVKFVLIDGKEISTGTYTFWLALHAVLLPLAGLAGLWFVRRRVGSRPHAADAGTPSVRRDDALARHGDPQPHA
jgi:quinol-cytochrome oxidoreductase complex cytochrome b subunit